jgi:septum formation protein
MLLHKTLFGEAKEPMSTNTPIILGSGSPFRKDLLASTGLKFEVSVAKCDEKAILGSSPIKTAEARALAKANAVSEEFPHAIVIGCDQVLSHQGEGMDKVLSESEAFDRLTQIQGDHHFLHSAYCLVKDSEKLIGRVVTITMTMKELSSEEIREYVATGEWKGCVGCYQFENKGGELFLKVDGTEDAIIGLPLKELLEDINLVTSDD